MTLLGSEKDAVDFILARAGKKLHLATPLGLGKPLHLLNALYERVAAQADLNLEIFTGLSLEPPKGPAGSIEERFLRPFRERHFGSDYPLLLYAEAQRRSALPERIRVHEFYLQPAAYKNSVSGQNSYVSVNYTHVARTIFSRGANVLVQLIAVRQENGKTRYSLGSNSDLTLDLLDLYKAAGKPLVFIGVVHPELPFTGGDAEIDGDIFSAVLEGRHHPLFALPREPISDADHMIGFHACQLVLDNGTLQIGIGSLSEALVHSLLLRHEQNSTYRKWVADWRPHEFDAPIELGEFREGLYGSSEMLMDGFMHLRRRGILKRLIFDVDEHRRRYMHAAFFLGSKDFYEWLRHLEGEDFSGLGMTRVSKVNDLYDAHELALRRQRRKARFFNTTMRVDMLGAAASDSLPSGEVISGVGGQFNFVAMAFELADAKSILMLRSTRTEAGRRTSNIVAGLGHETVPRHLRDIVITEYGVACLRGKSDAQVVDAILQITDAEFHDSIICQAVRGRKLPPSYKPPPGIARNTPERIAAFLNPRRESFPDFPFGSDFTDVERRVLPALNHLKSLGRRDLLLTMGRGFLRSRAPFQEELARLALAQPRGLRERLYAALITQSLVDSHVPKM